ncbi:MAG: aldo/keto reductase [Clostridia bacterium]|nr:aldo/keto reductase [Clostridia bacterium]MBN2882719.1 aldo/keto reductase [Clostridia bacterium]
MKYRKWNKINKEISVLGFGAMRLPVLDGDYSTIDEPTATEMIRHAIDSGVNYIDTAYPYHGEKGEIFVGKVLKDGYREKVFLTTKLPVGRLKEKGDMEKIFNEQLMKLDVEYLDFYLLHAVNRNSWENCKKLGVMDYLKKLKKEGKIRNIGFSFHDSPEIFKEVADSYDWDLIQIQFNYADTRIQAGMESFDYAREKGFNIVIMEPLKGGTLADELPEELIAHFESSGYDMSPVEWAFRWLYNFPEVKLILSGMSTMKQVEDNLRIFDNAEANSMSEDEIRVMKEAIEIIEKNTAVPCTDCKYCLPCPSGVKIPVMFKLYNSYTSFSSKEKAVARYKGWREMDENKFTADQCIRCNQCIEKCPQGIAIPDKLEELDKILYQPE